MDTESLITLSLVAAFWVFIIAALVIKAVRNKRAPVKTVTATVTDKHTTEFFSKRAPSGKNVRYVVSFSADGKRLSFYVSSMTYHGYRVGEKGKLTYKGDRIIDFR